MLKIRRPLGRLIFNTGIAIPGKTVFLIETAPRWRKYASPNLPTANPLPEPMMAYCLSEPWQQTSVIILKIAKPFIWRVLLWNSVKNICIIHEFSIIKLYHYLTISCTFVVKILASDPTAVTYVPLPPSCTDTIVWAICVVTCTTVRTGIASVAFIDI